MAFVATRPSPTGDARLFCSMRVRPGSMLQGSFWSFNDQGSEELWFKASYSLVTLYYGFAGIDWLQPARNDHHRELVRMFVVNFEFLTRFCLPGEAQGQYQHWGCCKREPCLEDTVLNAAAKGGVVYSLVQNKRWFHNKVYFKLFGFFFFFYCFYPVSSCVDLK